MSATDTMRWMGKSARNRATAARHSMKDRLLEKRLEQASEDTDRLRMENELLRDEVAQTRSEHERMLDILEKKLSPPEIEVEVEKKSHRGRWMLFLMALGGGAYAVIRKRSQGNGQLEWDEPTTPTPAVTQTSSETV